MSVFAAYLYPKELEMNMNMTYLKTSCGVDQVAINFKQLISKIKENLTQTFKQIVLE